MVVGLSRVRRVESAEPIGVYVVCLLDAGACLKYGRKGIVSAVTHTHSLCFVPSAALLQRGVGGVADQTRRPQAALLVKKYIKKQTGPRPSMV